MGWYRVMFINPPVSPYLLANYKCHFLCCWSFVYLISDLMYPTEYAGGGIWAIYPVVFSVSYFCGIFHMTSSIVLSITTLSTYILSAFRSPGIPPLIPWGSYPTVGKGGLEGYTFCNYCSKPKSSNTHHCRSCGICVLDMDHHCPFVSLPSVSPYMLWSQVCIIFIIYEFFLNIEF